MTSQIIPLPFVLLHLESVERKVKKKIQKFEYLEKEKSYFGEIKTLFIVLEGLSFDGKTKIADTSSKREHL